MGEQVLFERAVFLAQARDLVLKNGDQIAGHMAMQVGTGNLDPRGNATRLINEMWQLLNAGDVIEHVMLVYDTNAQGWDMTGVWNQILANNAAAQAPSRLNVNYCDGDGIDVTVSGDVVATDPWPTTQNKPRGKSFFIFENATKRPLA